MSKKSLDQSILVNDAGKLLSLYMVTGDDKYASAAAKLADDGLENLATNPQNNLLFTNNGFDVGALDLRATHYLYLPAYRITKDPRYLEAMKNFFDKANIPGNLDKYKPNGTLDLIVGLDSMLALAEITGEQKYNIQAKQILQTFINEAWDYPENPRFNSDFGFVQNFQEGNNFKSVVNNGWLVMAFLRLGEERFNVK